VTVNTTGSEKAHFMVILSCLANGTKLQAMVIFKRKTMPKDKLPSGVMVAIQEKGWVDKNLLQQWLKNVWDKQPGFTKEEIHAGVGYVQGPSCGFIEKAAEKKLNHAGCHTQRVYVTTAAIGCMPEQAI